MAGLKGMKGLRAHHELGMGPTAVEVEVMGDGSIDGRDLQMDQVTVQETEIVTVAGAGTGRKGAAARLQHAWRGSGKGIESTRTDSAQCTASRTARTTQSHRRRSASRPTELL